MKETMTNHEATCTLCAEISGTVGPNLYRDLKAPGAPESRIVLDSAAFIAMPSLGQIVDGYTILCSREHVPSIGASLFRAPVSELVEAIDQVRKRMKIIYGKDVVLFEHGCGKHNLQLGCGVNHAHLHIVPVAVDFSTDRRVSRLNWLRCDIHDLEAFAGSDSGYLFYTNPSGQGFASHETDGVPSQFFRQIVADLVLKPDEWDWRAFPYPERVATAVLAMRA